MADLKYDVDVSDLVRGRQEIKRWKAANSDAIDVVNSRMRTLGKTSEVAFNQFGKATQQAGRRTNQLGVLMQQTGYQVGDFAVQVQSGTNVMVALGQQATQLVGTFGMLSKSTRMIGVFAGLGILIPIVTGVAGAFMRMRDSAEEAQGGIKSLEDQMKGARQTAASLSEEIEILIRGLNDTSELAFVRKIAEAQEALKKAQEDPIGAGARGGKAAIDNARDAAIEKAQAELDAAEAALLSYQRQKAVKEELQAQVEEQGKIADAVARIKQSTQNSLRIQEDRIALAEAELKYGKDSAKYKNTQLGIEERILREQLAQNDILGNNANKIIEAWRNANNLEAAVGRTNSLFTTMSGLISPILTGVGSLADKFLEAAGAAGSIVSVLQTVGEQLQSLGAGLSSLASFPGLPPALTGLLSGTGGASGLLGSFIGSESMAVAASSLVAAGESMMAQGMAATQGTVPSGGGGGGVDPVEELKRAQDAVDQLRASYDEQYATSLKVAEAQEKVNELIRLNPELTGEANQVLQDYIASLEQAENPLKQIGETLEQSLGDAFMSIVDGSKSASDAFRDMARAVLQQAFELLVIKPILDSIFGGTSGGGLFSFLTPNANGNAFSNGNVIPFANGGVVSSPTMFPMAGSQTGLMGEAGPEAIMPLKRGKGGKLGVVAEGASQPVVIHQSFNFSANGDDSVKRIIAQEAPKIANMTQRQILDQRARGGAFKTTFG